MSVNQQEIKIFETKKVISTLHFMGVSLLNKKVIQFINTFVNYKLGTGPKMSYNNSEPFLCSNNIRILDGFDTTEEFNRVYGLFDDGIMCTDMYYDGIQSIKASIIDFAFEDIKHHYKVGLYHDSKQQIALLSKLLRFEVQYPLKFFAVDYEGVIDKTLLYEYYDIMDIVSTKPYNYTTNNEITVRLKPQVINTINTHVRKHCTPKSLVSNRDSIKKLLKSLQVEKFNNTIFIIPSNKNYVMLNGDELQKTDDVLKAIESKQSTIVTDSLITLNNDVAKQYTQQLIDDDGFMKRYIQSTGRFHIEGMVYVG